MNTTIPLTLILVLATLSLLLGVGAVALNHELSPKLTLTSPVVSPAACDVNKVQCTLPASDLQGSMPELQGATNTTQQ